MKILICGTIKRKINSNITASRSRLIYDLANGLINKGHEVSILTTSDSRVKGAHIIPVISRPLSQIAIAENPFYQEIEYLVKMAKIIEKTSPNFDIIHNHAYPEIINLLVGDKIKTPMLTTLHLPITKNLDSLLSMFSNCKIVCPSKSAKKLAKKSKISKVIYHGIDTSIYKPSNTKKDYLLWIGRASKAKDEAGNFIDQKGLCLAIRLAQITNKKLFLVGNIEDIEFYNKLIRPNLNSNIKWACPLSAEQPLNKNQITKLMAEAKAVVITSSFEETFCLVAAEAMSCGTPVISFDSGAIKELVLNNKSGFLANKGDLEKMTELIEKLYLLDKREYLKMCKFARDHVVKNFTIDKMIANYENYYKEIIKGK